MKPSRQQPGSRDAWHCLCLASLIIYILIEYLCELVRRKRGKVRIIYEGATQITKKYLFEVKQTLSQDLSIDELAS